MVVMGLIVSNFRLSESMSDATQDYVQKFWKLLDVVLNAILFILIAFVMIVLDFEIRYVILGIVSIFIVLLARVVVVYLPHLLIPTLLKFTRSDVRIITWGGLRGGLSIALVLSMPPSETRNVLLIATYCLSLIHI